MSNQSPTHTHETFGLEATTSTDPAHGRGGAIGADTHHEEGSNDHLASIYEDRADQFETVVPFLRRGLERGERCLYVADDNTKAEVVEALRDGGIDVEAARDSGALSIHTKADTYLRTGTFEQDAMLDFWQETLAEARDDEGYSGIRAAAEMTWALDGDTTLDSLVQYEAALNTIYPGEDYVVLCQYNRERFPPEVLSDVVRTHPLVVYDATVCENVYYYPPDEFAAADRPPLDLDRTIEGLVSRARTQQTLAERERYQRALYEITSSPDLSYEEKRDRLFDLGCEYFDLELGGIARIDPTTDSFEVEAVSGDHEQLVPGARAALSGTYCRLLADGDGATVGVSDPVAHGFGETRAYEEFGVNAYLGTRIELDNGHDRTFFFVSTEPREEPFSEAERTFHRLMGQWIEYELERQRREDRRVALNGMSRELMDAETPAEIAGVTVEHAGEALDLPVTAVVRYEEGEFSMAARTPRAAEELPTTRLCDADGGPAWRAFVAGETRVVSDAVESSDLTEVVVVPLGNHGAFVTATAAPGGFGGAEREFVETAAATVEAALARADRERLLQEHERTLEEKNERLERLNRINDTIRTIDQALVRASTRAEIETVVCEQLADAGPYELAWIGDHDPVTDATTTRARACAGATGTLDDRPGDADGPGRGPAERAVESRDPQVVNDILDEQSVAPWGQAALDRGYPACMALPLVYEDTLYGVLELYAGRPNVFDDLEREVLTELSDTVAHAINAVESKKALVSDEVSELEFVIDGSGPGSVALSRELGCEVVLESLVPRTDDGISAFFSTRGAAAAAVRGFAPRLPVTDLSLVSEREEDGERVCLFEADLADDSPLAVVLEHGGRPRSFVVSDGTARLTVELAPDAATREFVEMVRTRYPGAELVAQRSRERPRRTATEIRMALTEDLTDRQLEALRTAYLCGYFEQPRTSTGSEVADRMDIAQPTFHTHIRTAQRKLCRRLFEGEPPDADGPDC